MTATIDTPTASTYAPIEKQLSLQISADGLNWGQITFTGESADYVDAQAKQYVDAHRAELFIGFDESTCWSLFPHTFDAIFADAVQTVPNYID